MGACMLDYETFIEIVAVITVTVIWCSRLYFFTYQSLKKELAAFETMLGKLKSPGYPIDAECKSQWLQNTCDKFTEKKDDTLAWVLSPPFPRDSVIDLLDNEVWRNKYYVK